MAQNIFQDGGYRHLKFPEIVPFWTPVALIYLHTKFGTNQSRIGPDTPFCVLQDGVRRHLGFVILSFSTIHDVPVGGLYVPCQWRNDQLEFD